jgi:hypothetical protein
MVSSLVNGIYESEHVRTNMQPFDSKNHADSTRSVSGYFVPGLVSKLFTHIYISKK